MDTVIQEIYFVFKSCGSELKSKTWEQKIKNNNSIQILKEPKYFKPLEKGLTIFFNFSIKLFFA